MTNYSQDILLLTLMVLVFLYVSWFILQKIFMRLLELECELKGKIGIRLEVLDKRAQELAKSHEMLSGQIQHINNNVENILHQMYVLDKSPKV